MNLTITDLLIILLFVFVSIGILNLLRIGLNQWLKWDIGEKERILQQNLQALTNECDRYKEEVSDLRKQIRILLTQYDEAVIKLSKLEAQYSSTVKDADALREQIRTMQDKTDQEVDRQVKSNRCLIAAIGSNKKSLGLDRSSLQAVEASTGMTVQVINEATPDKVKIAVDKARRRRDIIYVHLAVDAAPEGGFQLMDTVIDNEWLSDTLGGVIILVIAAEDVADIGEFVGVVPYVVTMLGRVVARDSAIFAREFWTEVGTGIGPSLALKRALSRSPSIMKTYVTANWDQTDG